MLEAKNIHKVYAKTENKVHVLKGIDLTIDEGSVVSIVGPSGAGKSTLLHILGGLDRPSDGKLFLEGQDVYRLSDKALADLRNTQVGFVFQFYHLLPEFTALENVILPSLVKADTDRTKELRKKGSALLEQVGLGARVQHLPNQLSGGEQQRIAIARALINQPKIIFCDEPTGNLDSETGRSIIELLMGLNRDNGQTVVIVTHDKQAAKLAQKNFNLLDGFLTE